MGSKRIGLARAEALMENVKKELNLVSSTLKYAAICPAVKTVDSSGGVADVNMTEADYPPGSIITIKTGATNNNVTVTLPAVKAGLEYTIVAQDTAGTSCTVKIDAPVNMHGVLICSDGTEPAVTGDELVFDANKFEKGTQLFFSSDGVSWFVEGFCQCNVGDVAVS